MRKLARAIALLAAGAAAYYAAPIALRLVRPEPKPAAAPLAVAQPSAGQPSAAQPFATQSPQAPADRLGDRVLVNSLVTLERRNTVEAELVQSGYVLRQPVAIAGVYRQKGRGADRKFATLLQGRIADTPARLWQVSNGLFLYTDLAWGSSEISSTKESRAGGSPTADPSRRSVTRIDLRQIRQEIAVSQGADPDTIAMGQAAALSIDPAVSAAFGGLPMLLESLGANFHFGAPRKMKLHNQLVFAMVGYWKPASRAALVDVPSPVADAESPAAAAESSAAGRLPHHVLLVLGAEDLFPYLIEYRGPDDALAAAGLTDDARLQQSGRPQLRLEFRRPRFDAQLADAYFEYPASAPGGIREITAERIATLRKRQQLKIAARAAASVRRR